MRTKYKKYQEGGELPAREGRLSGKERRKLRQLRRQVRQGGGNRKSSVGLTAEEANIKNRLENRRRQNVADDFRRGVNAAAVAAGAGIVGKTGGFERLSKKYYDAVKGLRDRKKLVELVKKGAGPIENQSKELVQRALMKPKAGIMGTASDVDFNRGVEGATSPADPESFMNTMDVIANDPASVTPDFFTGALQTALDHPITDPKFNEMGSAYLDQFAQQAGGDSAANKMLSALGGFQGRPEDVTPLQSIIASPIAQNIVKPNLPEDIAKASKALGDFAGRAGLGALFEAGGRVKAGDPKKEEAMKLIALNEADYDNNLGDFYNAGEMAKADSVLQTMNNRYKRIVELGYKDKALDSLPYPKLTSMKAYEQLVKEQKAEDNR